jgi:hypothetical protein
MQHVQQPRLDSKPCAFRCGGRSCGNRDLPRVTVPRLRVRSDSSSQLEFDAGEVLPVQWGAFGKITTEAVRVGLAPVARAIGFPLFYCPSGSGPQSYASKPRMCAAHFRAVDVVRCQGLRGRSLYHHPEVLSPLQSSEEHGLDIERYEVAGTRMFRFVHPATPRFTGADLAKSERARRIAQYDSMGAAAAQHCSGHATLTVATHTPPVSADVAHCDTERVYEFNSTDGLGAKLTWTPKHTTLTLCTRSGIGWQQAPVVLGPSVTATALVSMLDEHLRKTWLPCLGVDAGRYLQSVDNANQQSKWVRNGATNRHNRVVLGGKGGCMGVLAAAPRKGPTKNPRAHQSCVNCRKALKNCQHRAKVKANNPIAPGVRPRINTLTSNNAEYRARVEHDRRARTALLAQMLRLENRVEAMADACEGELNLRNAGPNISADINNATDVLVRALKNKAQRAALKAALLKSSQHSGGEVRGAGLVELFLDFLSNRDLPKNRHRYAPISLKMAFIMGVHGVAGCNFDVKRQLLALPCARTIKLSQKHKIGELVNGVNHAAINQALIEFTGLHPERFAGGREYKMKFNLEVDEMKVASGVRFHTTNDSLSGLTNKEGNPTFDFDDVFGVRTGGDKPAVVTHVVVCLAQQESTGFCFVPSAYGVSGNANKHTVAGVVEETISAMEHTGMVVSLITYDACAVNVSAGRMLAGAFSHTPEQLLALTTSQFKEMAEGLTKLSPVGAGAIALTLPSPSRPNEVIYRSLCATHVCKNQRNCVFSTRAGVRTNTLMLTATVPISWDTLLRAKQRSGSYSELGKMLDEATLNPGAFDKMRSQMARKLFDRGKTVPLLVKLFTDEATTYEIVADKIVRSHPKYNAENRPDIATARDLLRLDVTGVPDEERGLICYLQAVATITE